jgi:quaternary ammonium compound-resistance protein SugE
LGWTYLILAGIFEFGFTTCMKLSANFSKLWPSLGFLACSILSFLFLNKAAQTIPLGTAYAVWTGIGALGTAIIGIAFFKDPVTTWRIVFLVGIVGCVLGLKWVSAE